MPHVAICVEDPPVPRYGVISKEAQETACGDYCYARQLTAKAVYADPPGTTGRFDDRIALATSDEAPFDAIMVWKTSRIAVSLEETISLRDRLRRTRLFFVTEKGVVD